MDKIYQNFLKIRSELPNDKNERMMPYQWGDLPDNLSPHWMPYSLMLKEFSQELANEINNFTYYINNLRAWSKTIEGMNIKDDDTQNNDYCFLINREFITPICTKLLCFPYTICARFSFAAAHLCHQANKTIEAEWSDNLPLDQKIDKNITDHYGKYWRKWKHLKKCVEKLNGKNFKQNTYDFRNMHTHRFSPHIWFGLNIRVKRTNNKNDYFSVPKEGIIYGFGEDPALKVKDILNLLIKERNFCYEAFAAFQELVYEHEEYITKNL